MEKEIWKNYEKWKITIEENEKDILDKIDNPLYTIRYLIEELYCNDCYDDINLFIDDMNYLLGKLSDEEQQQLYKYNYLQLNEYLEKDNLIKIYRGYTKSSVDYNKAVSFTPERSYAEQFANLREEDYGEKGMVIEGYIPINEVIWTYRQPYNKKLVEVVIKSGNFLQINK